MFYWHYWHDYCPLSSIPRFYFGSVQTRNAAKIAGPGRKRHSSEPDPSESSCASGSEVADSRHISGKCLKMASSGTASSEADRRRAQRGSDDSTSTSKKKQKDRANQESREAKRAAAVSNTEAKKGELTVPCCVLNVKPCFINHLVVVCSETWCFWFFWPSGPLVTC